MTKTYQPIVTTHLTAETTFTHPPEPPIIAHMDDPASQVMIDFKQMNALTITPESPLNEAAVEMKVCNRHLLLVVNKEQIVIGMVTSEDVLGEKPLRIAEQRFIQRSEVLVRMVMTPQEKIPAINVEELKHAKVGNIIETLHQFKQHYALVIETDATTGKQNVCGLFSLSRLSKQLGKDVLFDLSEAQSILELNKSDK